MERVFINRESDYQLRRKLKERKRVSEGRRFEYLKNQTLALFSFSGSILV